jgi:hypothetical protein
MWYAWETKKFMQSVGEKKTSMKETTWKTHRKCGDNIKIGTKETLYVCGLHCTIGFYILQDIP